MQRQPAVIRGAVVSVLSLLTMLGFSWAADVNPDTVAVIVGAVLAVLPLIQGLWTRRATTPAVAVLAQLDDQNRAVAGDAASLPTGRVLPTVGETVAVVPAVSPPRSA